MLKLEELITSTFRFLIAIGIAGGVLWMFWQGMNPTPVKYPDWDMDRCQADWDDFFSRAGQVAPPMSQEWLARCLPPSPGGTPVATGQ